MKAGGILGRFLGDQSGATAIEYGLIAAMISGVIVSITATGGAVDTMYDIIATAAAAMNN